MPESIWRKCAESLQNELPSQQFNTWIRPLKVDEQSAGQLLKLLAPNRFVLDWVNDKFLGRIQELAGEHGAQLGFQIELGVNSSQAAGRYQRRSTPRVSVPTPTYTSTVASVNNDVTLQVNTAPNSVQPLDHQSVVTASAATHNSQAVEPVTQMAIPLDDRTADSSSRIIQPASEIITASTQVAAPSAAAGYGAPPSINAGVISSANTGERATTVEVEGGLKHRNYLNEGFTFPSFVEGKSNQLGLAAARQVAENPGGAYNPLFIYGGVGLGKTHLMHAVGNALVEKNPNAKVVYFHSERFVADMVKALQLNAINDFKRYYRSVDALLIDDIQFFAGKERSQEEFFHTFNALLEGGQQIILTCDRYPKEINGLEERLKSRFGWGLTVAIEPPELETRVAILMKKADQANMMLPNDAAFFIAQRIRSNVRELEGALKRVIANAHFTGRDIDVPLVREALKDLLALQDKQVSIDNIQRVVAEYYKIKISDVLSKRRSRSVARPRQVAMSLAKELTNHSLPEIGDAFGGRDHTTVLHACRKIKELREEDADMREDWKNLQRSLTS